MRPLWRSRAMVFKRPDFAQSLQLQDGSWSAAIIDSGEIWSFAFVTQLFGYLPQRPLNGAFSIRKEEISWGGKIAKFKCNCSHCFVLRWMVGLSHYSPSPDMLPRAIWQLAKINHNQDGCRHCHSETVALGADRGWEQEHRPRWCGHREKKEDPEKGKQKKSNKNSMSPSTLFPSATLSRELMFCGSSTGQEEDRWQVTETGWEGSYEFNHPTRRKHRFNM